MDIYNFIAKSTLHVTALNPSDLSPQAFGGGCLILHNGKQYFLTVQHVGDFNKNALAIETGLPSENGSHLYSLGALNYYDIHELTEIEKIQIGEGETLDFAFCEVLEPLTLVQKEWNFGAYKVTADHKICLYVDEMGDLRPNKDFEYGFCGRIKPEFRGQYVFTQPTMKLGLKYVDTFGRYHLFNTQREINDKRLYEGCSGSPIVDEEGKIVGLVSTVVESSHSIFCFSIEEAIKLIDVYELIRTK